LPGNSSIFVAAVYAYHATEPLGIAKHPLAFFGNGLVYPTAFTLRTSFKAREVNRQFRLWFRHLLHPKVVKNYIGNEPSNRVAKKDYDSDGSNGGKE
jgi:hypothetical protein